ncbi:hypothetical protein GCM10020220_066500 [Nonomuraea rubra]|uniref:IspD/TarI family cytidylyltransferase n=1 Tax=Nonomuraea rubra TaxID=46180 RepID=UPI0031F15742
MDSRLRSVGVLLAGGVGQRVGRDTPKQLIEVAGRTIIEHSLAVFEAAPEIDEIVVLMTPGYADRVREIVARGGYRKVSKVVDGGSSRTESTWRALAALGAEECNVLLHDAVRPLLEPRIITECVRALEIHEAVNVAIPSSDTVLVATPEESIGEVLDRSRLRRSQTPQCFRLSVIREAYERAMADPGFAGLPATDDCGVVLRYLPEVPIHLVQGSERNIKVTHPADLHIAELLFRLPAPVPARRQGRAGRAGDRPPGRGRARGGSRPARLRAGAGGRPARRRGARPDPGRWRAGGGLRLGGQGARRRGRGRPRGAGGGRGPRRRPGAGERRDRRRRGRHRPSGRAQRRPRRPPAPARQPAAAGPARLRRPARVGRGGPWPG